MKMRILSVIASLALLTGCAGGGDFVSNDSGSSPPAPIDTSSIDSFNETQQRINEQMAIDAANAAAMQQNNDAMAAAQQIENNANAEFNQNGLH